jgi:hypothetical protein
MLDLAFAIAAAACIVRVAHHVRRESDARRAMRRILEGGTR